MTVTAARLRAIVSADTEQANRGLREFGRNVTDTSRGASRDLGELGRVFQMLPGSLGQIGGLLGGAFTVAGAATAAVALGKTALALNQQRAQAENVRKTLVAFAGDTRTATAATEAFLRATDNGVSRLDAQRMSAQMLGMGLATTADEIGKLTRMAVMLGDQTLSVTERMGSWNAMLANQSIERLDTFGISSGRVRTRILELMEADAGLTREQAFVNSVLEIGGQKLEAVEAQGVQAATGIDKVRAAWANLKLEAAQGVNLEGVLGSTATAINDIAASLGGLRNTRIAVDVDAATEARLAAIASAIQRLEDQKALFNNGTPLHVLKQGMADLQIEELQNLAASLRAYGGAADEVRGKLDDYVAADVRLRTAQEEANKISADASPLLRDLAQAEIETAQAARDSALAAYQAAAARGQEVVQTDYLTMRLRENAAAYRERSAAATGRRFDDDLGLTDRMTRGSTLEPAKPIRGSKAWNEEQEADRNRSEYLNSLNKDVAKKAGKSYQDAMIAAGKEAASRINGYLKEGMNFSIGLNDMTNNPLAPGQNGPFEEIYRLQAWLKDGSWAESAAKLGGDRGAIEGIVKNFQMGNFTQDVLGMVDVAGLQQLAAQKAAAQASQEKLAGLVGGDPAIIKSLLGQDAAGTGAVLSTEDATKLAQSLKSGLVTALDAQAAEQPGVMQKLLGFGEGSAPLDFTGLVPAMVEAFNAQIIAEGEQLKKAFGDAWDAGEVGFIQRARESGTFYRAVGAMIESYLASQLEQ